MNDYPMQIGKNRQQRRGILSVCLPALVLLPPSFTSAFPTLSPPSESTVVGLSKNLLNSSTEYLTQRHVRVRMNEWCGLLPLQHYRGTPLEPLPKENVQINKDNLSKSTQHMLQNEHELSDQERRRLKQKMIVEARASSPLDPKRHLHILYADAHICVVHKPSGVLCVPGPRRNPAVSNLVYDVLCPDIGIDQMVVHRLDMDTSGVVVYALTEQALRRLHTDFRDRRVKKTYHALVCGHVKASEGEIDLPLERDPTRPPFMRVHLPERHQQRQHDGVAAAAEDSTRPVNGSFRKFIDQAPKASLTEFRVVSREYIIGSDDDKELLPVTRLELTPHTGRTHQLRVHCAALGHPIIGDDIYGFGGEGSMDAGLTERQLKFFDDRASVQLQDGIFRQDKRLCLHAQQLCINHPFSGAPMIFEAARIF